VQAVFLVGGGDPGLSTTELTLMAKATVANLLSRAKLAGTTPPKSIKVYADDTLFPKPTLPPGWIAGDVPGSVAAVTDAALTFASALPPTWAGARLATVRVLTKLRIPLASLVITDGNGISRADRLTPVAPAALVRFITDRFTHPELYSIFWGRSVPTAGRTGPLAASYGRFTSPESRCAIGRVVAKTGTLIDVIALSGVAISTDGRLRIFSIMVNKMSPLVPLQTARTAEDALAAAIAC
jgi:D-alanyl-D-alanine carboxypeptidase